MSIKNKIKRVFGDKGISKLKAIRGSYRNIQSKMRDRSDCKLISSSWESCKVFEDNSKHVFFGYYDIQQFNKAQDKLLLMKVDRYAETKKDPAELIWVDMKNGDEHRITSTAAWCWQQGARLRWHPFENDIVMFNDCLDGRYITRLWNIADNKEIGRLPRALYDITPDMKYGFSLNYSRLQRLRPGYGYNSLPDDTQNVKAPQNDGLFRVNLQTGETSLMITLAKLSELSPESIELWNYINHISVSPNGEKLIFFHIWTPDIKARWMVALYCINADGTELKCLEHKYRTSHYDWIDEKHILTTASGFENHESRYIIYNVETGARKILSGKMLNNDGHPTVLGDKKTVITDTYPLKRCRQKLYTFNMESGDDELILDIFSDPRMYEEKRCDLHPRVTPDGKYITIDSTFRKGKRSVYLLKKRKYEHSLLL